MRAKRILCCLMVSVMLSGITSATVFADENETELTINVSKDNLLNNPSETLGDDTSGDDDGNGVGQSDASSYEGLVKVDGVWGYYENGVLTGLNALAKNDWGWWYIDADGKIDFSYNGVASNEWGTWCVTGGKVNQTVNGLTKVGNTWYYFVNGKLTGTNSLQPNKYGWWYIGADGKIDFSYNGVAANEWGTWCVIDGKVDQTANGLTKAGNTWYYFVNGKLTGTNSLQPNKYGWWYIGADGKIDFSYNGVASNDWGTWCVTNGKVNQSVNGLTKSGNAWYYFVNGKLTGLNGLAKNNWGWWYIGADGKIDFSYTGPATNEWGLWYVKNGKVDQTYNSKAYYKGQIYAIRNGRYVAADLPEVLNAASSYSKIIVASVTNRTDTSGRIRYYEKGANGSWSKIIDGKVVFGSEGVGTGSEYAARTPAGIYTFSMLFGNNADPGCIMPYHRLDSNDYWCGEQYYNRFVDGDVTDHSACSKTKDEHLCTYRSYAYAAAFNYNPECTVGKGSAFFLHWHGGSSATAGCVGVDYDVMQYLMTRIDSNTCIIIDTEARLINY